jgi:hypothetical protein
LFTKKSQNARKPLRDHHPTATNIAARFSKSVNISMEKRIYLPEGKTFTTNRSINLPSYLFARALQSACRTASIKPLHPNLMGDGIPDERTCSSGRWLQVYCMLFSLKTAQNQPVNPTALQQNTKTPINTGDSHSHPMA